MFGLKSNGDSFDDATVQAVWEKGTVVPNRDKVFWRKDACGALIFRTYHGNTNSEYGWEIDHIYPKSKLGSSDLENLQPLQWENNRHKGDKLEWDCKNRG